jgi:DNA-nicking Smr family endonuclease
VATGAPAIIEPGRYRRMAIGREAIGGRIDLHGMDQDRARAVLTAFIADASERGVRGVLVITGKGALGDGVLRRRAPEWLAEPPLRPLVAGLSEAHRRHGGEGALYVAIKRRRT